jgi:murein DD-endopeptidase MepM/ murein hydrolase activator NlpD
VLVSLMLAIGVGGGDLPRVPAPAGADAGAAVPTGSRWSWPVVAPHPIVRPYAAPANPYAAGHRGVDIGAAVGTRVMAPADGIVHFAGFVVDRPLLSIAHAGGVLSSFEPVQPLVETGDRVVRGQVIGVLLAGHCATSCLHLGARVGGEYVNPLLFLGEVPRAVLLPMG